MSQKLTSPKTSTSQKTGITKTGITKTGITKTGVTKLGGFFGQPPYYMYTSMPAKRFAGASHLVEEAQPAQLVRQHVSLPVGALGSRLLADRHDELPPTHVH